MFNILEATISQIQAAVAAKALTYRELTLMYLERIAALDSCDGGLNSVLEINPDALNIAQIMDDDRDKIANRGPMYGIPVLIKDNINTAVNMRTSAGSLALEDNYTSDADIIMNLKYAGAIILGKVNMTEFANWMSRQGMPNGYSSRGGQVLNPYNKDADVSGSSSGSAVAVAANLCVVSVGTETYGSIIAPSIANGIVGIKPTTGLLSGNGIIPISSTLDTAGPMARTVEDAAYLLDALQSGHGNVGTNRYYMYASPYVQNQKHDYTQGLVSARLRGLNIGVYGASGDDAAFNASLAQVLSQFESAGAALTMDVPSVVPESAWSYIGEHIAMNEFKACMDQYLQSSYFGGNAKCRSLKDIIEFNNEHADACLKYGQDLLIASFECTSGRFTEPDYIMGLSRREKARTDLLNVFSHHDLDVLIGAQEHVGIAPITGFPSGTIPIGFRENGVPIGLNFIAKPHDEARLIRAMYAAEQLLGQRKPPIL